MGSEVYGVGLRLALGLRGFLEGFVDRHVAARALDGDAGHELLDGAELHAGELLAVEGAGVEARTGGFGDHGLGRFVERDEDAEGGLLQPKG